MLSRRDRLRAATTTEEIKQTARHILVEQGREPVSLRAIAQEMGMTAPALYRYLRAQLERFRAKVGGADIPSGAMLTFLRCWVKLYGAVSMGVFGHLGFVLEDAAPMFEITLTELAGMVSLQYGPRIWRGLAP